MKKEVIFVLTEGFADWEGAFLSSLITNGGFEGNDVKYNVRTISVSKKTVMSFGGFHVIPDCDKLPDDYAALILLGGTSWKFESVKWVDDLVKDALKKNILIGALCDASLFLAINGYLNGIKHTSNSLEEVKKYAANYTGESNYQLRQAVLDNNIVTANGTGYLEFTRIILQILNVDTEQNIDAFYNLYKKGQYNS